MNEMNYFGGKNTVLFEIEALNIDDIKSIVYKVLKENNIELQTKVIKLSIMPDYENFYVIDFGDKWKSIQIIKK